MASRQDSGSVSESDALSLHSLYTLFSNSSATHVIIGHTRKHLDPSARNVPSKIECLTLPFSEQVARCGPQHQAGSDSLLTQAVFFRLRDKYFKGVLDDMEHMNHLYGLGSGANSGRLDELQDKKQS